jgi:hypothetical protein
MNLENSSAGDQPGPSGETMRFVFIVKSTWPVPFVTHTHSFIVRCHHTNAFIQRNAVRQIDTTMSTSFIYLPRETPPLLPRKSR